MSFVYNTYVIRIHYLCHSYTLLMSFVYITYIIRIHYLYHSYTLLMSFVHITYVIRTHYLYHSYTLLVSFVHITYVIRIHYLYHCKHGFVGSATVKWGTYTSRLFGISISLFCLFFVHTYIHDNLNIKNPHVRRFTND